MYLFQDEKYNWEIFFDERFNNLSRNAERKYRIGNWVPTAKEIYFLAYVEKRGAYTLKEDKYVVEDSEGLSFVKSRDESVRYRMFKELPLFTELPTFLHLSYNDTILQKHLVPMNDIISFELLKDPDERWIKEIEEKTKECHKIVFTPESSGDYLGPTWYHELIKDSKKFNIWKESFKEYKRDRFH